MKEAEVTILQTLQPSNDLHLHNEDDNIAKSGAKNRILFNLMRRSALKKLSGGSYDSAFQGK